MSNQFPQVSICSQGYPFFIEDHTNPEAEKFRSKIHDEIKFQQAEFKVDLLKRMLKEGDKELNQIQKNVLLGELSSAQRDIALLRQQLNNKYGVAYG